MDDLTTARSFDSQALSVIDIFSFFGHVSDWCFYNQALADVRSTGAGIKCLYCIIQCTCVYTRSRFNSSCKGDTGDSWRYPINPGGCWLIKEWNYTHLPVIFVNAWFTGWGRSIKALELSACAVVTIGFIRVIDAILKTIAHIDLSNAITTVRICSDGACCAHDIVICGVTHVCAICGEKISTWESCNPS